MTRHVLDEIAQRHSAAWTTRCACRWVSPWLRSRRDAIAAHDTHRSETTS